MTLTDVVDVDTDVRGTEWFGGRADGRGGVGVVPGPPDLTALSPMSYPVPVNGASRQVNARTVDWVRWFNPVPEAGPGMYARLEAARFGTLAAMTYPTADPASLGVIGDWITWLFIHDDRWCENPEVDAHDLARIHTRMGAVLRGAALRDEDDTLVVMLADLRVRMIGIAGSDWLRRFAVSVEHYFEANRWEATNRGAGESPPVALYVAMRRYTGAMETVFHLIEMATGLPLPAEVREHAILSRLRVLANNCVCWANDIMSVDKEIDEGNAHNLVLVLRHDYGLSRAEALEQSVDLYAAELQAFDWCAARLPSFGAAADTAVTAYVAGLRSWIHGNVEWTMSSPRYAVGVRA